MSPGALLTSKSKLKFRFLYQCIDLEPYFWDHDSLLCEVLKDHDIFGVEPCHTNSFTGDHDSLL